MTDGDASADSFARVAAEACGTVCGRLGWRVADFWAATPAELLMVLGGLAEGAGPGALTGRELKDLMEAADG